MSPIRKFLNWFTGKNDKEQVKELKETLPETPPPLIRKGSLEDIRDFCDEIRKDLTIRKRLDGKILEVDKLRMRTDIRLYVEMGNLSDKINTLIKSQKGGEE